MLITTEQQLKAVLPVNVNTSLLTLAPAIAQAEQKYIAPAVGQATLQIIANLPPQWTTPQWATPPSVADPDPDPADQDPQDPQRQPISAVATHLQASAAALAWWDSFDLLAVQLSEAGLQDPNGEHRAYRYQADAARETLRRQGFDRLNQAMLLLDDIAAQSPTTTTGTDTADPDTQDPASILTALAQAYRQSPNYSGNSQSLLPTSRHFFTAAATPPQSQSATLFARLRPFVTAAENTWLTHYVPQLTLTRAAQSATHPSNPDPAADPATQDPSQQPLPALAASLRSAVAYRALETATPLLWATLTDCGLVATTPDHGDQSTQRAAQPTQADHWQRHFAALADFHLAAALDTMKQNPALFPELQPYGGDRAKDDRPLRRDNRGRRAVFL